jgi:hypothetical protein
MGCAFEPTMSLLFLASATCVLAAFIPPLILRAVPARRR